MLVAHKPKAEHFYLTDDQKSKLCKMQAQMVVDAPYIGGSFDKVYDNCMKGDLQVMPSAYASIHWASVMP